MAAVEARRAQPGWARDEACGVVYDSAAAGKHGCRWPMRLSNTPLNQRDHPTANGSLPMDDSPVDPAISGHARRRVRCSAAAGPVPRLGSSSCGESVHKLLDLVINSSRTVRASCHGRRMCYAVTPRYHAVFAILVSTGKRPYLSLSFPTPFTLFSPAFEHMQGLRVCPLSYPAFPPPAAAMWGAFRATRPALDGRVRFTKPFQLSQSAKANRRTVTARMQANAHLIREGKAALAALAAADTAVGARRGAGRAAATAAGAATAGAASATAAALVRQAAGETGAAVPPPVTHSAGTAAP